MKIVVEGYDASGKSTLAKALAKEFGLSLVEAGPKPPNDMDAVGDSIIQLRMASTVHSRITPMSRLAYQLDNSPFHHAQLVCLLDRFVAEGAIFVFCTGKADTHELKDYDTDEHLKFLADNEETIRANYVTRFERVPHFKYDFKVQSIQEVICYIRQTALHS